MKRIFILVALLSMQSHANNTSLLGLNFNAPTINNKANVTNPQMGEMIFDSSDNTFYGNTDGTVSGWAPFGAVAASTILKATSSVFTPSGSGQYQQLSNNSLALTPGTWEIIYSAHFSSNGGSAGYLSVGLGIYGANGNNTTSAPTLLTATPNLTVDSTYPSVFSGLGGHLFIGSTIEDSFMPGQSLIVTTTSTVNIYVVTYSLQSNASNARITAYVTARKIN